MMMWKPFKKLVKKDHTETPKKNYKEFGKRRIYYPRSMRMSTRRFNYIAGIIKNVENCFRQRVFCVYLNEDRRNAGELHNIKIQFDLRHHRSDS